MLYTDRTKNLTTFYPALTRVWIKTDDPKLPLKGVWMNESALHHPVNENRLAECGAETAEFAEDHLLLAA